MKDIIISNCERDFVQNAIAEGVRLDGRSLDECRSLKICFGSEWGSCHVSLGSTKVIAHITCKVEQPKQTRPNEGLLFINVELGTMGAPNFDSNRQSDMNVYLNRLIEKCIRESRCVDLESLCIVSEEKVWSLRVDIHVLNHAGNLIECVSIAALASLAHFKRPDITTNGEEIVIHTLAEKDPLPIVLHHYPVCTSYGVFNDGTMVSDPNLLEEAVCSLAGALLVVGMNPYREICLLDLAGAAVTSGPQLIYRATQKSVKRVQFLVKEIKDALSADEKLRADRLPVGFANAIPNDHLMTLAVEKISIRLKKFDFDMSTETKEKKTNKRKCDVDSLDAEVISDEEAMDVITDKDMAVLLPRKEIKSDEANNAWAPMGSDDEVLPGDDDNLAGEDVQIVKVLTVDDRIVAKLHISSDSEEDNVVMLQPEIIKSTKKNPKLHKKKNKPKK